MLLTTKQAATTLGMRPITLSIWRLQHRGPAFARLGRSIRYSEADLQAFVAANKVVPENADKQRNHN
jgi:hypothetical protein